MGRYKKETDTEILEKIRYFKEQRPTYGHKRITAMINRERTLNDLKRINRKRVYRIMDMNDLLQKKYPKRKTHEGTGKVMTLHSNTRWCSDAFELQCFNGEKVYVAFSLDCRDREAIGFVVRDRNLSAEDIRNLMFKSVINRFEDAKTPHKIQWLTDRGTIYRARITRQAANDLGLLTCYTAPYSPSSNGMAESFVHTIKRDYAYLADLKDAKTAMKLLPKWFEDYNKIAPHSALNMMSPEEFRKAN